MIVNQSFMPKIYPLKKFVLHVAFRNFRVETQSFFKFICDSAVWLADLQPLKKSEDENSTSELLSILTSAKTAEIVEK